MQRAGYSSCDWEKQMNIASKLLTASVLALSIAAPAIAQEESALAERNVYLFMNGKMVHMQVSDATHAMIMREFKPLAAGTMIYFSSGKFYMATDRKMDSGKMLSTEIFGKDLGAGSQR
jgi:hypothetical protein